MTKKDEKEFVNHLHGKRMKKYIILAAIIMAVAAAFWVQHVKIKRLTEVPEQYRNTIAGRQDVPNERQFERNQSREFGVVIGGIQKVPGGRFGVDKDVAGKEPGFGTGYNNPNGNNQRIAGNRPG